ncbi:sulfotransferase family cytosolic 1B member 1-like [Branchiostoma floridae]|uniref:Sulfotransferase n=1 Tax=Branchiostoma floridae TaxID=7739 RepID=A0A9J7MGK0_BRAFL|nr:sulfotransferase family cytosolic 1B member 1-like [Branchiostoma floridae]
MDQWFEYKGALFNLAFTKESLDAIPEYVIRDDDVVIVTYVKAGTNWVVEIVNKLMRAAGKTDVPAADIPLCIAATVPGFGQPGHVIMEDQPSPRIIHTHLPWHLAPKMITSPKGKFKAIVVMRNPKDTAVSWYHYNQKLSPSLGTQRDIPWDEYVQRFLDGKVILGDFYDHALGWWQMRDDPHFLFLKYEDMNKDLSGTVRKIKQFLDISLDDVTTASIVESCTFASLTSAWADSGNPIQTIVARKGAVGDWKNSFSESQSKAFDAKYRERLEGTGLKFDFE